MPQVTAWECPRTKTLHKTKKEYVKHLKGLARVSLDNKAEAKRKAAKVAFFRNMRETIRDVDELVEFVKANWETFYKAHLDRENVRWNTKKFKIPKLIHLQISLGSVVQCSLSHGAPLGQQTNWCHIDKSRPTHAYGRHGQFIWTLDGDTDGFPSDVWDYTGIVNDGGGSSWSTPVEVKTMNPEVRYFESYRGDITLWADDWPAMMRDEVERIVVGKLLEPGQKVEEHLVQ